MSQRTSISITREGWYYLGMFGFIVAGAMIRDINLLYIMAGMMLGPMLFSVFAAAKSLRRLEVRRRFQPLVSMGDPLYVEVRASKPAGSSPAFATRIGDTISRDGAGRNARAPANLFYSNIPTGGSADASYRIQPNRRGRYRLGPMRVSTSMPLGLIRVACGGSEDESLLVSPQIGTLSPAWLRHLELSKTGSQKSIRKRGKGEGDFYGMREWRDGDSRNWIHWRTSAKRNKLTVRQFEQRISQDLVVLLDLWQPEPTAEPDPRIESVISFAATLVVEHSRQGSTQMLVAAAGESEFVLQGNSSAVFRQELLERLAVVEPSRKDRLPQLLADVLPQVPSSAKVILVAPRARNLKDTETFETIWKRRNVRRLLNDVVLVDTSARQFRDWFRIESDPAQKAQEESSPESDVSVLENVAT